MSFHDVLFPTAISFGSTGGLERRTEIVRLINGHEERNTPWANARRRYDAGLGIRSLDDLHAVAAFFEARRGQLYAFRWQDFLDCRSGLPSAEPTATDQVIGTGDGSTTSFQLTKTYEPGAHEVVRNITKPVVDSVVVAVGGFEQTGVAVDALSGVVTLSVPPATGATVTAGFRFHVGVRFDSESLEMNLSAFEAGEVPSIPLIEVLA
ncbi:MAG: DUF2460 domain-containing protein [Pseudomonadota bacterium]